MKTQKAYSSFPITKIMVVAILTAVVSCKSGGDAKLDNDSSSVSGTAVEPPQIDVHTAVLTENLEALKQHIAAGSNLNEKDPFGGSSPLITATLFDKPVMVKTLMDAGADINFQNNDGATALHTAAFFCRTEIVRMLLDRGADKTIRNKFGATPYESVTASFKDVKNTYDMMGKMLAPLGLKLDYTHIERTRPVIAQMLK